MLSQEKVFTTKTNAIPVNVEHIYKEKSSTTQVRALNPFSKERKLQNHRYIVKDIYLLSYARVCMKMGKCNINIRFVQNL